MKFARNVLFVLVIGFLMVSMATAHEGREVGDYTIEIGWREEPAYVSLMNGPEITVTRHEDEAEHEEAEATPDVGAEHAEEGADHTEAESAGVIGLEETLQIEVIFGPANRVLFLRPVRNEPGHYTADLIPMRPGDYTFRVFGTIEGTEVDETFSAANGQFSSVEPIEDIQFP